MALNQVKYLFIKVIFAGLFFVCSTIWAGECTSSGNCWIGVMNNYATYSAAGVITSSTGNAYLDVSSLDLAAYSSLNAPIKSHDGNAPSGTIMIKYTINYVQGNGAAVIGYCDISFTLVADSSKTTSAITASTATPNSVNCTASSSNNTYVRFDLGP